MNEFYPLGEVSQQKNSEKFSLFQQRLNSRLERLGIQQNELADRMHVSKAVVSNWLNARNLPKGANLRRLCAVLEVSADWLLGDVPQENATRESTSAPYHISSEDWRERALRAEKKFSDLQSGLRSLLELSSETGALVRKAWDKSLHSEDTAGTSHQSPLKPKHNAPDDPPLGGAE